MGHDCFYLEFTQDLSEALDSCSALSSTIGHVVKISGVANALYSVGYARM